MTATKFFAFIRHQQFKLALLLVPGFVLIVLPFLSALLMLGAYSLNFHNMGGGSAWFFSVAGLSSRPVQLASLMAQFPHCWAVMFHYTADSLPRRRRITAITSSLLPDICLRSTVLALAR